jgi:hypothetical protein
LSSIRRPGCCCALLSRLHVRVSIFDNDPVIVVGRCHRLCYHTCCCRGRCCRSPERRSADYGWSCHSLCGLHACKYYTQDRRKCVAARIDCKWRMATECNHNYIGKNARALHFGLYTTAALNVRHVEGCRRHTSIEATTLRADTTNLDESISKNGPGGASWPLPI